MYVIKKDGLWLLGFRQLEIMEYDQDGHYGPVRTALWGNRLGDALTVENIVEATLLAREFGGDSMSIDGRKR